MPGIIDYGGLHPELGNIRSQDPPTIEDFATALIIEHTATSAIVAAGRQSSATQKQEALKCFKFKQSVVKSLIDDGVGNADVDQRPAWATAMMETMERNSATFEAGIRSVNARIDSVNARIDGVNTRIDSMNTRIDGVSSRLTRLEGTFDSTRTLVIKSLQASAKASNRLVGFGTLENPLQAVVFFDGEDPIDDVHLPPLATSKDILNLNYNDLRSYAQGYALSPLPTPSERRASEMDKERMRQFVTRFIGASYIPPYP
ncbi:hypothetical protein DFP72DRAFT_943583 [Ephemerocybe angulata]|uniref:Mug135-like C-terminal domain-containing protein n=1 Tax=Ephemerocybe angulata TaxID=980116 RepID=A0A8H6LTC3_9AGAR|nr:hypothetical protein DFP72DRAFT_943583 [Tulosesus angulatus]